jgi:hypothetical protein
VEFKEMHMGELVVKCGLSSALRAMADAEVNPIVSDGDNLRTYSMRLRRSRAATQMLLLTPHAGIDNFRTFPAAYAAVQRCAATIGGLLKKNGCMSSQKTPYRMVDPPFEPETRDADGCWPQMSHRLSCDHRHNMDYELGRNSLRQPKTPSRRVKGTNKGCNNVVAAGTYYEFAGTKCRVEVLLYTDGEAVYYSLHKGRVSKENPLTPSTAVELIAYLKSAHQGHDLIPDVELVAAMPQARGIPALALNSVRDMRSAGMSMSAIYSALEVHVPCNTIVAVPATSLLQAYMALTFTYFCL